LPLLMRQNQFMKIINVVGARPQFIKAAMVSHELKKHAEVNEVIVHSGQHFDQNMSENILKELEFPEVKYNLDINQLSHGAMTGRMLEMMEEIFIKEQPDLIIVYGDTNTTLAGAIAAKKLQIPIAHVESGMRSHNWKMPEETNRVLTDRISDFLFCSSESAIQNLKKEGFDYFGCKMINCGDIMLDAALHYVEVAERKSKILSEIGKKDFVLCTIHREENTNDLSRLSDLLAAVKEINRKIPVIFPVHPRTKKLMESNNLVPDAVVTGPLSYFDMLVLLKNCSLVMTDSGGLQKEAYFFEKPCLTLRYETEWTELVDHGFNKVVGTTPDWIIKNFDWMMENIPDFSVKLYGEGHAAKKIVETILFRKSESQVIKSEILTPKS
jgi:UDP-GlcNAc3NAcA epimerase